MSVSASRCEATLGLRAAPHTRRSRYLTHSSRASISPPPPAAFESPRHLEPDASFFSLPIYGFLVPPCRARPSRLSSTLWPLPLTSLRPRSARPPQIKPSLCVFHGGFCLQMAENCKSAKQVCKRMLQARGAVKRKPLDIRMNSHILSRKNMK